jgi:outer membrane biosynthesis protein TonB
MNTRQDTTMTDFHRGFRALPILCALLLTVATAAPASAQAANGALDRVSNLIATGRFTEARNTLDQWERASGDPRSDAAPADRARALYLRGVLSSDAKDAEDAFLAVVLTYPSSAAAPDALLRLGQGLLTAGDSRRALAYLERLRSDYPGSPQRETGLLWLARAQLAAGAATAACATARDGAASASTAHLRTLIELERDRACADAPPTLAQQTVPPPAAQQTPRQQPPAQQPPVQQPPAQQPPAQQPPVQQPPVQQSPVQQPPVQHPPVQQPPVQQPEIAPAPTQSRPPVLVGDYAVQTGAYREVRTAQVIADQMRAYGFVVRVVLVDDSPLQRVRFGAFATSAEAAAAAQVIRNAGFATVIVNDVQRERR